MPWEAEPASAIRGTLLKRQSRLTCIQPAVTRTRPLPRPPMDCALGLCIRGLPRLIGESARPRREPRSPGRRACPVYASLLFSPDECCPRPRPDACGVSAGQNLPAFRRQYIASPELRLVLEPPVFSICVGIAQNPVIPAFAGMMVDAGMRLMEGVAHCQRTLKMPTPRLFAVAGPSVSRRTEGHFRRLPLRVILYAP